MGSLGRKIFQLKRRKSAKNEKGRCLPSQLVKLINDRDRSRIIKKKGQERERKEIWIRAAVQVQWQGRDEWPLRFCEEGLAHFLLIFFRFVYIYTKTQSKQYFNFNLTSINIWIF